jgi:hypothetical protein
MSRAVPVRRSARPGLALARLVALVSCASLARDVRAGESPDLDAVAFFEAKVRPVLIAHCQGCHGAKKQKGGLRLDRRESLLRGGDTGPGVVPGKPEESLLVRAVGYGEELKMPPKGKLPADQAAALRRWVSLGAPWPAVDTAPGKARAETRSAASARVEFSPEEKAFWAFHPPVERPVPAVKKPEWIGSPIDAFVLAKLEERELSPAPPADRRTLIRRVTYDLTGLPPTPGEVSAFVADRSPDPYPRLVERLLASPGYGEKWGRHWLDVARYADSNGMDENLAFAHAWRYRDYVVRAFNADLPFDQFVREQIAGDLLRPTGNRSRDLERLAATGLLVIGPKMLAEDDPVKMEMDIVDEQVDAVGKAFLGLTLGCARCHDHKFDPIRTTDYYGLAGIFKSTRTMEHYRVVARWNERPLATPGEIDERDARQDLVSRTKAEIDRLVMQANEGLLAALRRDDPRTPPKLPDKPESKYSQSVRDQLSSLRAELAKLEARVPRFPVAMAVADREAVDLRVHIRGNHLTLGPVVPRRFPVILVGGCQPTIESTHSGRRELANWLTRPDQPLTARVIANRVWLWHFGAGLVRSPDNFGRLGERPTHPELLDWLAARLVADRWSLKSLNRMILLSSTYQMSTAYDAKSAAIDPDNRFFWRMNRRRLEAEEVRDTLLATSGRLDRTMGGSLLKTDNRKYVAGTASVNNTNYDSRRRSIYLPVIRSALYDLFQAFDFADPSTGSGQRDTTTVAPQALCIMNSGLIQEASLGLARSVLAEAPREDASRLADVHGRTLGREPTAREIDRGTKFLRKYRLALADGPDRSHADERELTAWQGYCRVILSSSELLFVD